VEGTGGLADRIAAAVKSGAPGETDPDFEEIVKSRNLHVMRLDDSVDTWYQALEGRPKVDVTLQNVWNEYRRWHCEAVRYKAQFRRLQWAGVGLAVAATLFAILQVDWHQVKQPGFRDWIVHLAVIAFPILTTGLAAFMNQFRPGSRWLLLRGGAEAIKREIFRYRAGAGPYGRGQGLYRATVLSQEAARITKVLANTEANRAGLEQVTPAVPTAEDPDPLSPLTGDQYAEIRLADQIGYYEKTTLRLDRSARWFHVAIYAAAGSGAFLAAVGFNRWVALTTAVVAALTGRLEAEQQESALAQYNHGLASLKGILNWWTSLSQREKTEQTNVDRLINDTETTLQSEMAGWIQQMQRAIDKAQQQKADTSAEGQARTGSAPVAAQAAEVRVTPVPELAAAAVANGTSNAG
jgi:hypothetical protein